VGLDGVLDCFAAKWWHDAAPSLGAQLHELFAKVGSFYPQRENFRLTPDVKEKFTEKLRSEPREFFGRKVGEVLRKDGSRKCGRTRQAEQCRQAMDFRVGKFAKIRSFPKPEDGLRAFVKKGPQAEALAERWLERSRPLWATLYRERRRLATAGVVLLTAWLFLHVMFGANGMVIYRSKRAERRRLQADIDRLQKENDFYTQQIRALQTDPKAIEREAREQLHYTRPGEVIYVAPPPPRPPASNAARK
jgi:cell division protein FtsB